VARGLVAAAGIAPGDLVLDIGAGTGAVTAALVDAGAAVIAVELHRRRAAQLRVRFAGAAVTVVCADATDLRLPRRPFRVVANPPFAAMTAVLRRLTAPRSALVRADLVVPRYVAARWSAGRGAGWGEDWRAVTTGRVERASFRPPPPSDAAVLVIERLSAGRRPPRMSR
jgi:23S rRNA (adenine-N6)-dimethyltransferase